LRWRLLLVLGLWCSLLVCLLGVVSRVVDSMGCRCKLRDENIITEAMDRGCSFKTAADREKYLRAVRKESYFVTVWLVIMIVLILGIACVYYQHGYDAGAVESCRAVIDGVYP